MDNTIWEILSLIGAVAFALSGAIVAIEEKFDILGILVLGFMTAFGGGTIRNLLIGLPMSAIWNQGMDFNVAFVAMLILMLVPRSVTRHWAKAGLVTDAIGLAAFSIQGAIYAENLGQPLSAVIVAAVLTGTGGGVVRDLLAGRKPGILRREVYAGWSILAAVLIHYHLVSGDVGLYILVVVLTILRLIGVRYNWQLPKINWETDGK